MPRTVFETHRVSIKPRPLRVQKLGAWFILWCLGLEGSGCASPSGPLQREGFKDGALSAIPRDGAPLPPDAVRLDAAVPLDADRDWKRLDAEPSSAVAPRLSELVGAFFGPTCVLGRCHTTLAPAGGLSLTNRGTSVYDGLVNVPSSALPDRIRVVPYDPSASYLIEKLESEMPAAGTRMPPANAGVSQDRIDQIRAWILAGALDD